MARNDMFPMLGSYGDRWVAWDYERKEWRILFQELGSSVAEDDGPLNELAAQRLRAVFRLDRTSIADLSRMSSEDLEQFSGVALAA